MAVYKDKNGTWYVSARYTNWKGEADRKVKRGFGTKREAAEWEKNFFLENAGNLDMTFEAFYQLYKERTYRKSLAKPEHDLAYASSVFMHRCHLLPVLTHPGHFFSGYPFGYPAPR